MTEWIIRKTQHGEWNLYVDGKIAGVGVRLTDALTYIQQKERANATTATVPPLQV